MFIQLVCAGFIVFGNANSVIIRDDHGRLYARQVKFNAMMEPRVYEDDTQMRLTIAHDQKRIWINPDIDDRPGRGDEYHCKRLKR